MGPKNEHQISIEQRDEQRTPVQRSHFPHHLFFGFYCGATNRPGDAYAGEV